MLSSNFNTLGILADLLETRPGLEELAEAGLGQTIKAVVLDNENTLEEIACFVKQKKIGDINVVLTNAAFAHENTPAVDGHAPIVKARAPADGLIKDLTSRWKITPDLKSGLDALKTDLAEGKGPYVYITRDRDILHPWGEIIIRGGGGRGGILSRRADLSRLSAEMARLGAEIDGLKAEESGLSARRSKVYDGLKALMSDEGRTNEETAAQKRALERLEARLEAQTERMERLGMEGEQAQNELLELEIGLEAIEEALEEANRARAEAEARIRGREDALRQQELVLSRRAKALEEAKIDLAGVSTRLEGKRQELSSLKNRMERIRDEKGASLKTKNEAEAALNARQRSTLDAAAKAKAQEDAAGEARRRMETMRGLYDQKRQELARLEADIKDRGAEINSLRKDLHQNELDMGAISQTMQFLKKTAMERLQKDPEKWCEDWLPSRFLPDEARSELALIKEKIDMIGPINLGALEEYKELEERSGYLSAQKEDLNNSIKDMEQAMRHIDKISKERLKETLAAVNSGLKEVFPLLFEGGEARLEPTGSGDILDMGMDFMVHIPGKKIQHLNLLSGGEKALAALSLIFSLYLIKPSPFCLMDEADAPLDEANTLRFCRLVKKMAERSQMVIITHNQRVMEHADTLYGVTMEKGGISQLVSVELTGRG